MYLKSNLYKKKIKQILYNISNYQGSSAVSFKNGSKIHFLFNKLKLYDYFNNMIDIAIFFTSITAYEFEFDPNKNESTRFTLYIFLSIFTVIGFIVNWFGNSLQRDFQIEVKGELAKTSFTAGEKFRDIFGKLSKKHAILLTKKLRWFIQMHFLLEQL